MRPSYGSRRAGGSAAALLSAALIALQPAVHAADFDGSLYARNVSLDANLDVFWTIDNSTEVIRVAVHAKAASGWASVGVSEMGGMEGADMVLYETATGNVTDTHSLVAGQPIVDECTQDWTLLSAEVGADGLVFEAERPLDTGDIQDRVFADDSGEGAMTTRLIAAWGDTDTATYHFEKVAKGEVVLFGGAENSDVDPLSDIRASDDVSYFDVRVTNFTIPPVTTWYEDTCLPASELPNLDEYHVLGFEGIIQNDTSEYVHHLVVTGWVGTPDCGQSCFEFLAQFEGDDDDSGSSFTGGSLTSSASSSYTMLSYLDENNVTIPDACLNLDFADIFPWAPGAPNVQLPADVGFKFGNASGGFTSVSIQTHYNNPEFDEGKIDNSGVRLHYTEDLRPIEMGVIRLGDPFVALSGQALPDGKSLFSFDCPSSCTEQNFEAAEVTIFSHFLHMHATGQRMIARQYRNISGNEVLIHTAEAEYYSFVQAGGHTVTTNGSFTIQGGDRFEADCFYDTSSSPLGSNNVTFGAGSEDEMCIDYLYYYPNQYVPTSGACGFLACGGSISASTLLDDDSDFNRTFGIVDTCAADVLTEDGNSSSSSSGSLAVEFLPVSITAALTLSSIALML